MNLWSTNVKLAVALWIPSLTKFACEDFPLLHFQIIKG